MWPPLPAGVRFQSPVLSAQLQPHQFSETLTVLASSHLREVSHRGRLQRRPPGLDTGRTDSRDRARSRAASKRFVGRMSARARRAALQQMGIAGVSPAGGMAPAFHTTPRRYGLFKPELSSWLSAALLRSPKAEPASSDASGSTDAAPLHQQRHAGVQVRQSHSSRDRVAAAAGPRAVRGRPQPLATAASVSGKRAPALPSRERHSSTMALLAVILECFTDLARYPRCAPCLCVVSISCPGGFGDSE